MSAAWVTFSGNAEELGHRLVLLQVDRGHRRGQAAAAQRQLEAPHRGVDRSVAGGQARRSGILGRTTHDAGDDDDRHLVEV